MNLTGALHEFCVSQYAWMTLVWISFVRNLLSHLGTGTADHLDSADQFGQGKTHRSGNYESMGPHDLSVPDSQLDVDRAEIFGNFL
jgi:hypothetical protein